MNNDKANIACVVCGGTGGFKQPKQHFLDNDWIDCVYCQGNGFVIDTMSEEECRESLKYDIYVSKIRHELTKLSTVHHITSEEIGKDLYIQTAPIIRTQWVNLVKTLLKFQHHSDKIEIIPKQAFQTNSLNQNYIYWELYIKTTSLSDLDGFIDLLRMYNESVEEVSYEY